MTGATSTDFRIFENAETLAHDVAHWLCGLAQASEAAFAICLSGGSTLLGVGEDRHTASLFPDQPALHDTQRWVVAVIGAKAKARITLTYPALNRGCDLAFVATGAEKRHAVARAQAGDRNIPAGVIRPLARLHWFTDLAAAPERTN